MKRMKTKLSFRLLLALVAPLMCFMGSCSSDDDDSKSDDYAEWKARNELFVDQQAALSTDGVPVFEKVTPVWSPLTFYLRQWLSDRSLTEGELTPLDNSLVSVSYRLENIDGTVLDSTYWDKTDPDEGYITHPYENVIGFHHLLTTMRPGDEAKIVVPASAGYGNLSHGSVQPYSTLVFTVKLLSIKQYETN